MKNARTEHYNIRWTKKELGTLRAVHKKFIRVTGTNVEFSLFMRALILNHGAPAFDLYLENLERKNK